MPSLFARPRWAAHACVAPTIVNNNPKTVELTRRPPPTLRGCVRDAGAATLMCGRKFGEYSFLEDSRYTSQQEICGARGFIRRACGGSRRLRRPLPASGARERIEIAARLVDRVNASRVDRHASRLQLDLAVEALDQRAPLRIELVPVDGADLGEIVLGLGDGQRDRAFELHLRVGGNHIIRRLEHLRLDAGVEMLVDIFDREIR